MSNSPESFYPVIVVGAGPTGLTLANLLGRYGIQTLLIERNASTVQEPRAVSIDDESLRTMQAAGVVEAVLANVVEGYGSVYLTPRQRPFLQVLPRDRPYGYPRRNAFRQPRLEAQLRDGLERYEHIQTLFGYTLRQFTQSGNRVHVELAGANDEVLGADCSFLVGADGANSTVRGCLGIRLGGESFDEQWLIVDLENSPVARRDTIVFCDPRRPCIALPGPNLTRRFEFKLLPGETAERMLTAASVSELLERFGAARESRIARKVVYTFHALIAPRWSVGRVFLAGDACHLTPPFAGQGMNSGVRDAHNLAWKLAAVLKLGLGINLLTTYEEERKAHVAAMIQLALSMGRIMSPPNRMAAWVVQTAFRLLGHWPNIRQFFSEMRFKPKPRFTSGFLITRLDGAKPYGRGVGELLPQPRVRDATGRESMLDELLGDGFALVAITDDLSGFEECCRLVALQRLGVRPLVISSSVSNAVRGIEVVADVSGSLTALAQGQSDTVFLVRPDRYVAGTFTLAQSAKFAARLAELLATMEPEAEPHGVARGRRQTQDHYTAN